MAIKFFDDISLDKQEIQSVALENLAANPAAPTSGQIYFNTGTDAIRYYDGAAWIELDGSGNVDSVTGSNGLINAGSPTAVDIEPNYTTAGNIVLASAGTGALVAGSKVLASVGNIVGPYTLTQLGAVINPLGFDSWTAAGDSGSSLTVNSTASTVYFGGGSKISTSSIPASGGSTPEIQISHESTTRTDTTSTAAPATGGTFTAVDSVSSDSTGHVTAINLKTVTLPVASNITYTIPVAAGAGNTAEIVLTPSAGATGGTVTIGGTTNEIAITESTGSNGSITIGLPDDVTIGNDLTVTGDMSAVAGAFTGNVTGSTATFTGQVTIPQTPTAAASAASKNYVDQSIAGSGALIFQGGYNATVAPPTGAATLKGFTYVVTTAGDGNGFFSTTLEIGDLIISNQDNPVDEGDWTEVQNNIDKATNSIEGISKFLNANGFASGMTAGQPALISQTAFTAEGSASSVPVITTNSFGAVTAITDTNIAIPTSQVTGFDAAVEGLIDGYRFTSAAFGGSTTATINHSLGSVNVLVQVFLVADGTTLFAKTARTDANNVTLTFSTAPAAASMKCVIVKCD